MPTITNPIPEMEVHSTYGGAMSLLKNRIYRYIKTLREILPTFHGYLDLEENMLHKLARVNSNTVQCLLFMTILELHY